VRVSTDVEPTPQDIDRVIRSLEQSWTATITVRRQSPQDVGYREIFVSLDGESLGVLHHGDAITRETTPGPHRLRAHNTLFWKTIEFTLLVGQHARFMAINQAGWGTYSALAFFIGFLGAGPLYLTFEQEHSAHGS
jgi:hypothetical protein